MACEVSESIEIKQVLLGLKPYVLIEAEADPDDGELVLSVNAGAGAGEQISAMPLMLVAQMPAEDNLLTEAVGYVLAEHPGDREALARLAAEVGFPMPGAGGGA